MAIVKCEVCGKGMNTAKGNSVFNNGVWTHKKCPVKTTLNDIEKCHWNNLRDRINELCVQYDRPANWTLITAQIKRYKEMGYTYQDQLYTLNYIVEKDGTFWGYGRVEKFFSHAMTYRQKYENFIQSKKVQRETKPININSKSNFKIDI